MPAPPARFAGARARRLRSALTSGLTLFTALALVAGLAAGCGSSVPGPPPASLGATEDRPIPAAVAGLPLVDAAGRTVTLASLRGRTVVLADFLTSCQEVCPFTVGAFAAMRRAVAAAGLGGRVAFVEITVDPGRDTPARLAAYARLTGADWTLLTGGPGDLAALWHWFGVYYQKVPAASPPGTDWQTGAPYTYDVDHSDIVTIIDASGHQRFLTQGVADVHRRLSPALRRLLNDQGRRNLAAPGEGSWTPENLLGALSWVEGRRIAPVGA